MILTPVQLFGSIANITTGVSSGAITTAAANAGDLVTLFMGTSWPNPTAFTDSNGNNWGIIPGFEVGGAPGNLVFSVLSNTMPINTSFICNSGTSTNTYNFDGGYVTPGASYWWEIDQQITGNTIVSSTSISQTVTPRFVNSIIWAYVTTQSSTGTYTDDPAFTNLVNNGSGGLAYRIVNQAVPNTITYHPTWVTGNILNWQVFSAGLAG